MSIVKMVVILISLVVISFSKFSSLRTRDCVKTTTNWKFGSMTQTIFLSQFETKTIEVVELDNDDYTFNVPDYVKNYQYQNRKLTIKLDCKDAKDFHSGLVVAILPSKSQTIIDFKAISSEGKIQPNKKTESSKSNIVTGTKDNKKNSLEFDDPLSLDGLTVKQLEYINQDDEPIFRKNPFTESGVKKLKEMMHAPPEKIEPMKLKHTDSLTYYDFSKDTGRNYLNQIRLA